MKVIVGISGGIDSAVTAWHLLKAGIEVLGCYVVTREKDPEEEARVWAIVSRLGIPCQKVSRKNAMEEKIITPMIRDYGDGKTPNPCLHCNATIKFPTLLEIMRKEGAASIATGHYVQKSGSIHGFVLKKGIDPGKDQSYMLSQLPRNMLDFLLFPLGAFHKEDIRRIALKVFGDLFSSVPESQDLCFLKNHNLQDFLETRLPGEKKEPGRILSDEGEILGKHYGLFRHTVGQRKGLGLSGGPWFVCDIHAPTNTLYVGSSESLKVCGLWCSHVNWFVPPKSLEGMRLQAKVRYGAKSTDILFFSLKKGLLYVETVTDLQGVAPGQGLVLYAENIMVCGAIIRQTKRRSCNEKNRR
jgi:tRNA-specific 2-thiouridylase